MDDNTHKIASALEKVGLSDLVSYWASLAAGEDPRRTNLLVQLMEDINELGAPDEGEWEDLLEFARKQYANQPVDISVSTTAAAKLTELAHAKMKPTEEGSSVSDPVDIKIAPLTDKDIRRVVRYLEDKF